MFVCLLVCLVVCLFVCVCVCVLFFCRFILMCCCGCCHYLTLASSWFLSCCLRLGSRRPCPKLSAAPQPCQAKRPRWDGEQNLMPAAQSNNVCMVSSVWQLEVLETIWVALVIWLKYQTIWSVIPFAGCHPSELVQDLFQPVDPFETGCRL